MLSPLIFCFSLFYSNSSNCLLLKHPPHLPLSPSFSLCLSLKRVLLWWESIHGFNGFLWPFFFQDLGDVFKKKRGKSWPTQALLPRAQWTAEDSISVCIKRMRNFQLTKQGEQVNMDLRPGCLKSNVRKKKKRAMKYWNFSLPTPKSKLETD